jgi:hypothetical protein
MNIVLHIVQDVARTFDENDQTRAKGIQGVEGRDFGLGLHGSALREILLDAPGFAKEERHMLIGNLHEPRHGFHGAPELVGESLVFLVLPGVAKRRKSRLEQGQSILNILVKPLQFVRETPNFSRVHDGLRHSYSFGLKNHNPV